MLRDFLPQLGKEGSGVCREVGFTGTQSFSICAQSEQKNSRGISENETLILFSEAYIYMLHIGFL